MDNVTNQSERSPGDYLLFALAFLGFGTAGGGIVTASAFLALSGLCLLLIALIGFALADRD